MYLQKYHSYRNNSYFCSSADHLRRLRSCVSFRFAFPPLPRNERLPTPRVPIVVEVGGKFRDRDPSVPSFSAVVQKSLETFAHRIESLGCSDGRASKEKNCSAARESFVRKCCSDWRAYSRISCSVARAFLEMSCSSGREKPLDFLEVLVAVVEDRKVPELESEFDDAVGQSFAGEFLVVIVGEEKHDEGEDKDDQEDKGDHDIDQNGSKEGRLVLLASEQHERGDGDFENAAESLCYTCWDML
ncbi:hypothetical protein PMAYCL1PPCAC_10262 [Pristionchus mayeri]|uniref:Uncharacterized protein n=1 Tax=Pristionchus mayeri TaxID=1317129 RepID=A0AAN5CDZ2_9BILA|nr:hypothetical protein PMAYCL1PPCAC_10262 [Pristionchus mayeri]